MSRPSPASVGDLVKLCEEYLKGERPFEGKPEEFTKQTLIEPLLEQHLLWPRIPDDDYYEREFRGPVKGKEWKDIALLTDKKPRLFVETKACTDTKIASKYAKDLLTYLKNYNADKNESEWVTWGVLTNFTNTYFYHWSEPLSDPSPFYEVGYTELPSKLQELQSLLSPEGVRNNRLQNRFLESRGHKLDEDFLQDLKKWRKIIANGFYKDNQSLSLDEVSELSHIFLSRLIFIRRLEATGVLQPHWLKNQYEAWIEGKTLPTPTFSEYLRELVKNFWRLYDTELFEEQACDRYPFEDSYFKDLLKYMGVPLPEVRRITGVSELQDRGLYGYKFAELTLDILGAAYERYLAHRLEFKTVNKSKIVTIEETTELRQKEGAYFTPAHIVRSIVSKTLELRLRNIVEEALRLVRKHEFQAAKSKMGEIESLRVLDPASGSGSFLIEAFKTLIRYYSIYNEAVSDEFKGISMENNRTLDFQIDKVTERVLLQNLYGVDLDPKAVEITKLNLWLHHIDANQKEYQHTGGRARKKLLPMLDLNIQVGNSLVEGDGSKLQSYAGELARISDLRKRIADVRIRLSRNRDEYEIQKLQKEDRALKEELDSLGAKIEKDVNSSLRQYDGTEEFRKYFNWKVRFPEVFADGGFDVYVGNPPYINLYKFSDRFRDYLSKRDKDIFRAKNDLLYHFYKRGLELLKNGGSLGYVTSRYFLEAENADLLRQHLASRAIIRILIDYGNVELFRGISTRCVVIVLDRVASIPPESTVRIGKVRTWNGNHAELTQLLYDHIEQGEFYTQNRTVSTFGLPQKSLGNDSWRLLSPVETKLRSDLEMDSWKLGGQDGLCNIGMGMQTGFDDAFRVTGEQMLKEGITLQYVRKLVRNGDIRRYVIHDRGEYWIYTEDLDVDALGDNHSVKRHLLGHIKELRERYPCRTCGHCSKTFKTYSDMEDHWRRDKVPGAERVPKRRWYQYTVPNIKQLFAYGEKIVVPYKAPSNRFALDDERRISSMDVYICVLSKNPAITFQLGLRYLLAVLNSSLMDYAYITFYGRRKKSEFEYYTNLIQEIPIRKPSTRELAELEELAKLVRERHSMRIGLLELFAKRLQSSAGATDGKLKHYYDNGWPYKVVDKERLLAEFRPSTTTASQKPAYTVYKIGVEEVGKELLIDAEFQFDAGPRRRELLVRISVDDEAIRRYVLYSIKLFVEDSRRKEVLGRGTDPLDVVLKHVELKILRTNMAENAEAIRALMADFKAQAVTTESISKIEREIWERSKEIDERIFDLYELDKDTSQMIRGMYECNSVSEYFDRLEEYVGVEDIQEE